MIKGLRTKFIILSTASLLLLLIVIVTSGSILTYRELVANADAVLDMLADRTMQRDFLSVPKHPEQDLSKEDMPPLKPPKEADWNKNDTHVRNKGFFGGRKLSPEAMYESRFFTITISSDGEITDINTDNIFMVDDAQAGQYANAVLHKEKTCGFVQTFRYRKVQKESDTYVIFLDCGRSLDTFKGSLAIDGLISFAAFLVSMVIIIIFSKKIVRPVAESYEKQKQFISMAGHELKTPLTIISADAEVLAMDFEEENEWLLDICNQTKRMAILTNDLLSLSRMDENREPFTMIEFPISDVVGETVQSFQTLAHSEGKQILAEITPMLSYVGDEKGIRQITGILLDNAIKYAQSKEIDLKLRKKGHTIILSVTNSSEALTDGQLKQFFDRFYRTEQSHNSEKGGYGLGLSIAKSIVEAHKGKITASAPKEGFVQLTVTLKNN
ncbi:MAG: HAMP domain-containing histidine kinase [Lachnospiraceae bacterium]|nr:HAMP domain-containing histidine kinase [Lachnospiraceae bacterium]